MTTLARWYDFLKQQTCIRCGRFPVEIAHIKAIVSAKTGQLMPRRVGISEFAAVPLCSKCHRTAPDSIHNVGEEAFFESMGRGDYLSTLLVEFLQEVA